MDKPLEINLLITAWHNAKKNVFEDAGWNIDPETGEVITGEMPDDLADLVTDIDDRMMDLDEHYRNPDPDGVFGENFEDEDLAIEDEEEVPLMF